jgi:Cdc6-like AAA superfamily ATPase
VTDEQSDIESCFEKARKNVIVDMINDLSDPTLMILQSIGTSRSGYAKDIYKKYSAITLSYNDRPFSYVHFYSHLSYLQSMGLVALLATKVNRTYTNRVMLTFDEPILEPIFEMRFRTG